MFRMHTLYSYPLYQILTNSSYKKSQPFDDRRKNGSRNDFQTDIFINGEYFRSRTNNQYFCVVDKNTKIGELSNHICDFRNLDEAVKIRNYNPEKHIILRLEFVKNKSYFVESYQAITIKNPDVTLINIPLEELRKNTPTFTPLDN